MARFSCSIVALLIVAFALTFTSANQVYVSPFGSNSPSGGNQSNPFETLQYALGIIKSGDSIVVLPGVYTGEDNFPTISINVTIMALPGTSGPSRFVFDGQGSSGNAFSVNQGVTVTFNGLTVRNSRPSSSYGNGAITAYGTVFVTNSSITGNTVGLGVLSPGNLTVTNSDVSNNAVGIINNAVLNIQNSNVSGPGTYGIQVGNYYNTAGDVRLLISQSTVSSADNGVYVGGSYLSSFELEIDNSLISNCSENGLYLTGNSNSGFTGRAILRNTTIQGNGVSSTNINGAGIYLSSYTSLLMQGGALIGNVASSSSPGSSYGQGGGLYCNSQATVNIDGTSFIDNVAYDGGAGWCDDACAFLAFNTNVVNNTQTQDSGPCDGL